MLTKAAVLYYLQDFTQGQVARRLGVSRQTVGRLLARARKTGVVEITVQSPLLQAADLEVKVESTFGLAEAVVVRPAAEGEDARKEALGRAAARFLERHVRPGDTVGVSWGSTLYHMARQLQPTPVKSVKIVQLNGSIVRNTHLMHAEYIVQKTAKAFRGIPVMLAAPQIVDRKSIRDSLLGDSQIAEALALARRCRVAVFGIGSVSRESSLYRAGYLDEPLLRYLRQHGAVGEICGRFYGLDGQPCAPDLGARTIAVDLADLRSKRLSVAVAAGPCKIDALLGALEGRYCQVLITDEATAQALLDRHARSDAQVLPPRGRRGVSLILRPRHGRRPAHSEAHPRARDERRRS